MAAPSPITASQRDAIETLIYVYEVAQHPHAPATCYEQFARADEPDSRCRRRTTSRASATKMATGSGKTKVMSLAIAWQYLNAIMGGDDEDYARTFLIIAPNVIVLERLAEDFAGGRIFLADPVMPPDLRYFWELETVVRGDRGAPRRRWPVLLTNIQQLYEPPEQANGDEPERTGGGAWPQGAAHAQRGRQTSSSASPQRDGRCSSSTTRRTTRTTRTTSGTRSSSTLHDTASHRQPARLLRHAALHQKGQLFPWVISDYPLKQAIIDGVVKRPYQGRRRHPRAWSPPRSPASSIAASSSRASSRWREYRAAVAPLGKRPLLFIMLNSNDEADDVGDYLSELSPAEFGGEQDARHPHRQQGRHHQARS